MNENVDEMVQSGIKKFFETNKIEDLDSLTLENYTERTKKRFRMSKEQKSRNITREEAFQEFLTEQKKCNTSS